MTTSIVELQPKELTTNWKWRSNGGAMTAPSSMETRHLFYTLRMIWNHTMPFEAHVGRNIIYHTFGEFYTPAYMKQAIYHIWAELQTRQDIAPKFQKELAQMHNWFVNRISPNPKMLSHG